MNKRVQEASGIKRGPMLTALLIGAFVAFLNENLLANALPGLMLPVWIGTGGRPESAIRAGKLGLPLIFASLAECRKDLLR